MQELSRGQEIKHTSIGTQTWEDEERNLCLVLVKMNFQSLTSTRTSQHTHKLMQLVLIPDRVQAGLADRTDRRTDCLVVNLHITQEHPRLLGSLSPSLSLSPQDCRMADPHKHSPEQSAGLLSEQATSTASFGRELRASVIYCAIKIFPLVCPKPAV